MYVISSVSRFILSLAVGLALGATFWNVGDSSSDLSLRTFASFVLMILSTFVFHLYISPKGFQLILSSFPIFMAQRDLFRRDYASKFYSWAPFSIVMVLVDLPYLILDATVCVEIAFWCIGLNSNIIDNTYFWAIFVIFIIYSISFGQLVGYRI